MVQSLVKRGFGIIMTTHNPDYVILLGEKAGILDRQGYFTVGERGTVMTEARLRDLYQIDLRMTYVEQVDREVCVPENLKTADERISLMETIDTLENGVPLSFAFEEMLRYHDPSYPGGAASYDIEDGTPNPATRISSGATGCCGG